MLSIPVRTLDELKNLSLIAYTAGDMNWLHKICASIEIVENEAFKAWGMQLSG